jgi:two-component system CheB/CheR fusion protein
VNEIDSEHDQDRESEQARPVAAGERFPVVGIGASAGGIAALRRLLPGIPPDCGMAFVVVQHLDPNRSSLLAEILGRSCRLPVVEITDGMTVEPNHVYVVPPDATLTISDGRLRLVRPVTPHGANSIDEFLLSLAAERDELAACVVLSGTGSDGTIGLRAVKEAGGLTIAQADAEYDGMMRSAVATGLVDFVLLPEDIPDRLEAYFGQAMQTAAVDAEAAGLPDIAPELPQIAALLRAHTGHDFSNYKDRTIIRRVRRRMHVLHLTDVQAFVEKLKQDSHEITLLFQDLLIGVTSFFRDPEAFAALEQVIPDLFRGKTAADTVRVWVPGCATGEEAYSIAILLREHAPKYDAPRVQIFATDIDEHALETARGGRYPCTIGRDVSPDRLERFFLREDGTYRIGADLREICLFSAHNLLRDAPFSRLDLISCRNLLIYLNSELQSRIIPLFHYALLPNGTLFLGTSENVTRHARLFNTLDKAHRIFRRRSFPDRRVPDFPLTAPDPTSRMLAVAPRTGGSEPNLRAVAERVLVDRFAPAYVVINTEGDVLQSSGGTGKYLELPAGTPDINIFSMARSGLRLELRAALHRAITGGEAVVLPKLSIGANGGRQELDVYVQPLRIGPPSDGLYLVVFQDIGGVRAAADLTRAGGEDLSEAGARQLETELRATRERLQSTTEELEASNEELKSGNEELQSMNEELQSSNEELETSKEELQSVNEELQTVNAELNARVEELSRANNDMRNLLESTQIATVFLDRGLNVKGFTPAAKDVFRLVESDTGRPIMHVRARFECDTLQADAERVLRTLGTVEKPVDSKETGTRYMMRILPYRTADNVISGVVITFTDLTRISAAEARIERLSEDLRARVNELETVIDLVPVGVMIAENGPSQRVLINPCGLRLLGGEGGRKGLVPVTTAFRLFEQDRALPPEQEPLQRAARSGEIVGNWQGRLVTDAGVSTHVMISATPLFTEFGQVRGAIAAIVDMTAQRAAADRQQELLHELQHRVKNILATVSSLATRMLRRTRSLDEFREAFLARLNAMGRMHDLLAGGSSDGAALRALAELVLQPYSNLTATNIRLSGDAVRLKAGCAATIGMILHELVSNAVKYGALSVPQGRVEVSWQLTGDGSADRRLQVIWLEQGGPPPVPRETPGFGTRFIQRSVEYELHGSANLNFAPDGLRCVLEFPAAGNVDSSS